MLDPTRAALTWSAPETLSEVPPSHTFIEFDAYDWWHFRRLAAFEPAFFTRLKRSTDLVSVALDVYGLLYKGEPKKRAVAHGLSRSIAELLDCRGDLARLRARTVLNEWATVTALPLLLEPLFDAVHRGRRSPAARGAVAEAERSIIRSSARGEPDGSDTGDANADASDAVANDVAGAITNALAMGRGAAGAFAARRGGGRAMHRLLDHYEEARDALETFDRAWGLDGLPDVRGSRARPMRRRLGKRECADEPPWRRSGVPRKLWPTRGKLVSEMRARIEAFETTRRAVRAAEDASQNDVAEGRDEAMNSACAAATASVEDAMGVVDEVLSLFRENDTWGRELGAMQAIPLEELLRLGRTLRQNKQLREIIEIAGRWSITLKRRHPRGKSPHGRREVVGVGLGGEIDRLLPSELALLRHKTLRLPVLARILERRALVTAMEGPHLLGRGPVMAIVDTSGSMSGAPIILAKALCLALALRCWEKRRPFYVLTFGSAHEISETVFRTGDDFLKRLNGCMQFAFGGGTDFDQPLTRVCDLATEKVWSQSDAVFITDGHCGVSPGVATRLAKTKKETDLQVIGVVIGRGSGLEGIADVNYTLDERVSGLGGDDLRGVKLFQRLATRL